MPLAWSRPIRAGSGSQHRTSLGAFFHIAAHERESHRSREHRPFTWHCKSSTGTSPLGKRHAKCGKRGNRVFPRNTFVKYDGYTDKVLDRVVTCTASKNSAKDCSDGNA